MNKHTIEVKSTITNYKNFVRWFESEYSTRPIEQCDRWELREGLSYYNLSEYRTDKNIQEIATAIKNNQLISWENQHFTILDEAMLQHELRKLNLELISINQFPLNSVDLKPNIKKAPIKNIFLHKYWASIIKINKLLDKFYIKDYSYFFLACVGMLYVGHWEMLFLSFWAAHFYWAFSEYAEHEYLIHKYVIPKNTLLKYLITMYTMSVNPNLYKNKECCKQYHFTHHIEWGTTKDVFTEDIKQGKYYNFRFSPFDKPSADELSLMLREYCEYPLIIKHLRLIQIAFYALLLWIIGLEYFLYLVMIPLMLVPFLLIQHDWYLFKFGHQNYKFLWPLALNQAWHYEHHVNFRNRPSSINETFFGPRWIRYINLQYYFARLFFKVNK